MHACTCKPAYPLGHRHGGYTTRLRTSDATGVHVASFGEVLGDLRGLPTARLTDHDQHLVVLDRL